MEEIKIKVKSKQLDGSTEVADTTMNGSNQFTSENSVIPPSGGGGGSSFLGTLNEDNLLFEFEYSEEAEAIKMNNSAPEGFEGNHIVVIVAYSDLGQYYDAQPCALGWLYEYLPGEAGGGETLVKISTNLSLAGSGEDYASAMTILDMSYYDENVEDKAELVFKVMDREGAVYLSTGFGNYDNNAWHNFKVYLLK